MLTVGTVFLALNDPGAWHLPVACPFLSVTGLQCPGCGSLRALHDILNLRISKAFHHNPVASALMLLAPVAVVFRKRLRRSPWWGWGFALVFSVFWVVRNL